VNVRELKERRPTAKSKEASVFTPETRPRQMPVKEGEAKPVQKKSDRTKELRQPSRRVGDPTPSVSAQKQGGGQACRACCWQNQRKQGGTVTGERAEGTNAE